MNKYSFSELDRSEYESELVTNDPYVACFYTFLDEEYLGMIIRWSKYRENRPSGEFNYLASPPREMVPFRPADGDWSVQELAGEDYYVFSTLREACDYLNECHQTLLDLTAS